MIKFVQGDIFQSQCEAIVNPVNCVGVMGAGLALAFKDRFPANYDQYVVACREEKVRLGKMFITECNGPGNLKWIINYPTKKHWKDNSKIAYVRFALFHFKHMLRTHQIKSVAIPRLGCGKGNLDWAVVRKVLEDKLSSLTDIEIEIYE